MYINYLLAGNYFINQINTNKIETDKRVPSLTSGEEQSLLENQALLALCEARSIYHSSINSNSKEEKKLAAKRIEEISKNKLDNIEISVQNLPGIKYAGKIKAKIYTERLIDSLNGKNLNTDNNLINLFHERIMRYQEPMIELYNTYNKKVDTEQDLYNKLSEYNSKLKTFIDNNYKFSPVKYYDRNDVAGRKKEYIFINGGQDFVEVELIKEEQEELKKIIGLHILSMIEDPRDILKDLKPTYDAETKITLTEPIFKKEGLVNSYKAKINTAINALNKLKNTYEKINNFEYIKNILKENNTAPDYENTKLFIQEKINQCIGAENKCFEDITKSPDSQKYTSFYLIEYRTKTNILEYQKLLNKIGAPIDKLVAKRIGELDKDINEMEKELFSEEYKATISLINKINNTGDYAEKKKIAAGINKTTYESLKKYINNNTQYHDLYEARKGKLPGGFISFKNKKPGEGEDDKSGKGLVPSINEIEPLIGAQAKENAEKLKDEAEKKYKRLYNDDYNKSTCPYNNDVCDPMKRGEVAYNGNDFDTAITIYDKEAIPKLNEKAKNIASGKAKLLEDYLNGTPNSDPSTHYDGPADKKIEYSEALKQAKKKIDTDPFKALDEIDDTWKKIAKEIKEKAEAKYNSNLKYKDDSAINGLMQDGKNNYDAGLKNKNTDNEFKKSIEAYSEAITKMNSVDDVEKDKQKEEALKNINNNIPPYNYKARTLAYTKLIGNDKPEDYPDIAKYNDKWKDIYSSLNKDNKYEKFLKEFQEFKDAQCIGGYEYVNNKFNESNLTKINNLYSQFNELKKSVPDAFRQEFEKVFTNKLAILSYNCLNKKETKNPDDFMALEIHNQILGKNYSKEGITNNYDKALFDKYSNSSTETKKAYKNNYQIDFEMGLIFKNLDITSIQKGYGTFTFSGEDSQGTKYQVTYCDTIYRTGTQSILERDSRKVHILYKYTRLSGKSSEEWIDKSFNYKDDNEIDSFLKGLLVPAGKENEKEHKNTLKNIENLRKDRQNNYLNYFGVSDSSYLNKKYIDIFNNLVRSNSDFFKIDSPNGLFLANLFKVVRTETLILYDNNELHGLGKSIQEYKQNKDQAKLKTAYEEYVNNLSKVFTEGHSLLFSQTDLYRFTDFKKAIDAME